MREAAKLGEMVVPPKEFDRLVEERVPQWRLIHAVRVRDFHHYGVQGGGRIMVKFSITVPAHGHAEFSMYADPVTPCASLGDRVTTPSGDHARSWASVS